MTSVSLTTSSVIIANENTAFSKREGKCLNILAISCKNIVLFPFAILYFIFKYTKNHNGKQ